MKFAPDADGGKEDGGDRPSGRGASLADAIDVDAKNTGETNREIVDNIVANGLMTFPNVEAEKRRQGIKKFKLAEMKPADMLRGWSCPCGNKPNALQGTASALRKAIILHLREGKGKDKGAAHQGSWRRRRPSSRSCWRATAASMQSPRSSTARPACASLNW